MAALVVGLVSACGGGGDDQLSAAELRQRLLTTSDLPSGFTVDTEAEEDGTDFCQGRFEAESLNADQEAEIDFEKTSGDVPEAIISQFLGQWSSDAEVEDAIAEVQGAAEDCATFEETTDEGLVIAGNVQEMSFPEKGDETFAVALSADVAAEGDEVPIGAQIVYVREGSLLLGIFNAELGEPEADTDLTEELVDKALAKL